jgi:hypothetical protein
VNSILRLTAAQRIAIVNPANSLLVFDTDSKCFFFYASSNAKWNSLCGSYNQKTILCSDFTASKNIANTSEQILKSCTIPANYLSSNGTWVEIESFVNINPSSLSSPKDTIYLKVKLANITIDSVQFFVTPAQPIVKYISNIRISNTIQKIVSIQGQVPSVYNFNLSTNLTVDFIMQISSPDANVVSYETISIRKIE